MNNKVSIAEDKKLTILFRVEPGSIGPDGPERVQAFCKFAQSQVKSLDNRFIKWTIVPRFDKALPEIEYKIANKRLTHDKAEKYLDMYQQCLDDFECILGEKISELIDQFLEQ